MSKPKQLFSEFLKTTPVVKAVATLTHPVKLDFLKEQFSEFEEIIKGGVGSGKHAMSGTSHVSFNNDTKKISFVGNKKDALNHVKSNPNHTLGYSMNKKVGDTFGSVSKSEDNNLFHEVIEIAKGTAGKHWHWHGHPSSDEANKLGAGYKNSSHNADVSRFSHTFSKGEGGANAARITHQSLHDKLTALGFDHKGTTVEELPWRKSTESNYQHPDGTQVQSMVNQAKDDSTENSHGFSVYHAAAPNTPAAAPPATSPATAPVAAQGTNYPDHMKVANTILQQYGGNKFRAMTGAHSFIASKEGGGALTMKIPKTNGATKGVKYVKTIHDPATDTYNVHMLGRNGDVKHTATGIYADQLQSHFKHHTGLDTHL